MMFYTMTFWVVVAGVVLVSCYFLFKLLQVHLGELSNSHKMKRRAIFRFYFLFTPSSEKPTKEELMKVKLILRGMADEVHLHHRRWVTDCEVIAADAARKLHEQMFHLAEKEFKKALKMAIEFDFISPCYTQYNQFLSPEVDEQETSMLELGLTLARSYN